MIFLTVGTQLPFPRMIRAVDEWCKDNADTAVFGQVAADTENNFMPQHFDYREFLEPNEFSKKFDAASVIVAHAGMGSILTALSAGKPIIIMPRKAELKEHRNDHQMATAARFKGRDNVYVVETPEEMAKTLSNISEANSSDKNVNKISAHANDDLVSHLREFILAK
jgi:UDP-N-acetylglucosamine transferase subunit ALG13